MPKIKRNLFLFVCLLLCVAVYLTPYKVFAEGGSTGGGDETEAGTSTSSCSSWPYKGKIGLSNTMLRGVRITVVDNDGKVKPGSKSVDYVKNTGVTSISGTYYSSQKTTKTMYLQYGSPLTWNYGTVSVKYDLAIATYIISKFGDDLGGSMGLNIRALYEAYENNLTYAKNIVDTIYADTEAGSFDATDVILFEPITYIKHCDRNGNAMYAFGTAYELNARFKDYEGFAGNEAGSNGAVKKHIAKALYFQGDQISSLTDVFREPWAPWLTEAPGRKVLEKNGWGMGAIWIGNTKKCDLNINNNDDRSLNWTEYDPNCDIDGDMVADGCWKKIEDGCCENPPGGVTAEEIYNRYPQCADSACTPENKKYTNGVPTATLSLPSCNNDTKTLQNYYGTSNLNMNAPKYCLANNNLYTGQINGKYYGCEIKDELIFPKKNNENLTIGQYFYWPTSKTLQKVSPKENSYPLTRKSTLRCQAYKFVESGELQGQITYVGLTSSELETIKDRFTQRGTLELSFDRRSNGNIIEESVAKNASNNVDGTFKVTIENVYTLEEVNRRNGIYAYYNQEELAYTNRIITSDLSKYVQYKFPIIPYGDYVKGTTTKKFTNTISVDYGVNYTSIGVSGFRSLRSYSGSYICTKSGDATPDPECKCLKGTKHEGIDLIPHFRAGYTNFAAECAVAQDMYCDGPTTPDLYKCRNGVAIINITTCVNTRQYGGSNDLEAYNLCSAEKCPSTPPPPPPGLIPGEAEIIYRPIFLDDPFPSIRGTIRKPGSNWGGSSSISGGTYTGLVDKYITGTADKMYQGQPMYRFEITPAGLRQIRNYNSRNKYDDFEMECSEGKYCVSKVLRGDFSVYFTGGTCRGATEAKRRGSDDCREDALRY